MWTHTSSGILSWRTAWGAAHGEQRLRARLRETQARGYALNPGLIVEGSFGLGAAVFTREGHPQWALSLTGVEFRFGPDRLADLGRTLLAHAHQLTTRVAAPAPVAESLISLGSRSRRSRVILSLFLANDRPPRRVAGYRASRLSLTGSARPPRRARPHDAGDGIRPPLGQHDRVVVHVLDRDVPQARVRRQQPGQPLWRRAAAPGRAVRARR